MPGESLEDDLLGGSVGTPLQIGGAARSALTACHLARLALTDNAAVSGLTPDMSGWGFGSPSATQNFFATGMTPGNGGTPLSEIKCNLSTGSGSPSYSPSMFAYEDKHERRDMYGLTNSPRGPRIPLANVTGNTSVAAAAAAAVVVAARRLA